MKKQHSPYTKKLIKNGVALVTAGLILIAATFAWFALNEEAKVSGVSAAFDGLQYSVEDDKATPTDNFQLLSSSFTSSAMYTARSGLTWTRVPNSGSNPTPLQVDPLFPGEYAAFRIDVSAAAGKTYKIILQDLSVGQNDTLATVLGCVSVNMITYDGTSVGSTTASGTLSSLYSSSTQDCDPGITLTFTQAGTMSVYLDVGMVGSQETLRTTGATLSINKVIAVEQSS